ncbi:CBS domain-containing protein [Salinigranum marinum]|uniref:CBS domain-containing protein n=1 Tax=Salinigranum marinum TaxID=1515595 RepID=UPI002989D643|nr:CBS domain-containing protein [Salinigranum marinum]
MSSDPNGGRRPTNDRPNVFDVTVRAVMRRRIETAPPSASARTVVRQLHEADAGSIVVVDEAGDPVGIVTDSDVLALVVDERPLDGTTAADCLSAPVVTVDADDGIEAAAETLREHDIDQAPVLDDGALVGVVSVRELSYYLPGLSLSDVTTQSAGEYAYEDRAAPGVDVGDVVRFSKRLDDGDLRAFARASGDENPLHLDDAYAATTRFGGRIAHGVLTLGVVSAALSRLPGLVVYLSQSVRFVGPVAVGDRVTAVCEIVEALGGGRYRLRTTVRDEDGDSVIDGEAVVWIDTRSGDDAEADTETKPDPNSEAETDGDTDTDAALSSGTDAD